MSPKSTDLMQRLTPEAAAAIAAAWEARRAAALREAAAWDAWLTEMEMVIAIWQEQARAHLQQAQAAADALGATLQEALDAGSGQADGDEETSLPA